MARKNRDIEILVKLASQGNFDQAQEQLNRLKAGQESAAGAGVGAIGKLQGAWKTWTSLAEVSSQKIKNAFLTALGPIGAIIVIVETVIRTFAKLISFIKDYQKEQEAVNKTFADASKAIADANRNKEKYADTTGIDNLSKALKAQEQDLQAIKKSHEEIATKITEQKESFFGHLFVLASTTIAYREQAELLAQQKKAVEDQIAGKLELLEFEKELEKSSKLRADAEDQIADRIAKLTLDDTELKERELGKQIVAYQDAKVQQSEIDKLITAEALASIEAEDLKRQEANEKLEDRLMDELELKREKLNEELAAYAAVDADKNLIDQLRAVETGRIDKEFLKKKKEKATEEAKIESVKTEALKGTFQALATFQNAKTKELAVIGKAAALAMAYINTAQAVTVALKSAPPPFNFILAGAVAAAGAAQVATIVGVELAEGGVVPGSAAGTAATIGEKGRAEAVLPLENPRAMQMVGEAIADAGGGRGGLGGATIINLNVTAALEWRTIMNELAEAAANGSPEIIRLASRLKNVADQNAGRAV